MDKNKNKVKLNCTECKAELFVDKSKIQWGGANRMCRPCMIKKNGRNYII